MLTGSLWRFLQTQSMCTFKSRQQNLHMSPHHFPLPWTLHQSNVIHAVQCQLTESLQLNYWALALLVGVQLPTPAGAIDWTGRKHAMKDDKQLHREATGCYKSQKCTIEINSTTSQTPKAHAHSTLPLPRGRPFHASNRQCTGARTESKRTTITERIENQSAV